MATLSYIIGKSIQRIYEPGLGLAGVQVEVNILDFFIIRGQKLILDPVSYIET